MNSIINIIKHSIELVIILGGIIALFVFGLPVSVLLLLVVLAQDEPSEFLGENDSLPVLMLLLFSTGCLSLTIIAL